MTVSRNGTGFSEENQPFEGREQPTTSAPIAFDRNNPFNLTDRERAEIAHLRIKLHAFTAIQKLWRQRHAEGMSKKDLADRLQRDPAWVSRALAGPGNWTMRTLGELAHALGGHIVISAVPDEGEGAGEPDLPPARNWKQGGAGPVEPA